MNGITVKKLTAIEISTIMMLFERTYDIRRTIAGLEVKRKDGGRLTNTDLNEVSSFTAAWNAMLDRSTYVFGQLSSEGRVATIKRRGT